MTKYEHPIVKYTELAAKRRGIILNRTIDLEKIIDWRISTYYASDMKSCVAMTENVMPFISLRNKIELFISTMEQFDSDFFKLHPKRQVKRHLDKIRDVRNKMAHSALDVTVTFVGNRNKLRPDVINLKNSKNQDVFDERRISALEQRIIDYCNIIGLWGAIQPV